MAFFDRRPMIQGLVLLALPALAACASMQGGSAPAATDVYAGKSVLDAAIAAAGGEAALSAAHELDWTGAATVNSGGKTTEIEMQTIVRPFTYARSTSWPKPDGEKSARTIQMDFGKVWTVSRVTWTPMPAAQEENEIQQFALYGAMTLVGLKDPAVKVTEQAPGKDGSRTIHVEHPKAPPMDLTFNKAGKLIQAKDAVRDPAGGAMPIAQVIDFSGEVTSNGVKWPQRITITQNGQPYFDLQIATFETRTTNSTIPLKHTLQQASAPEAAAGVAPATGPLPAAVAAAQAPGQTTFNTRCIGCHGSGRGGAPAISTLQAKAPAEIVEALTTGKMEQQGSALSAEDKANVAMFLTRKPL